MLNFKNKQESNFSPEEINMLLAEISQIYKVDEIPLDRVEYLTKTIQKFGYLPYPQFKVLDELTPAEAILALIEKLKYAKTLADKKIINFKNPSVLARKNIKNSNWFKKEGHNIKLLCLSALGDGNKKDTAGHFIDWIKALITLDSGNDELNILPTTLYLIPFFEREFNCAYLPKATSVSSNLEDENLNKFLDLDVDKQVKLFIELAQLCNHPVIYDILPQTARFSKVVLLNPSIARWIDVKELIEKIIDKLNGICGSLMQKREYLEEDIIRTKKLYIDNLKGNYKKYTIREKAIVEEIEAEIEQFKIQISIDMAKSKNQKRILKKVQDVILAVTGAIKTEDDIKNQNEIIQALIKEGLWTLPGGAWCSAGVPVFIQKAKIKKYPMFKHYDKDGNDVTNCANLDCQTPFYFYLFDEKKYNKKVIDFYIDYILNIQKEFNFDGFRIDHIDHVVDCASIDSKNNPISYRIPSRVLEKLNSTLKKKIPYFGVLAEYMLWDDLKREYHKDMKFDLLWGNDIIAQSSKTPKQIIEDNLNLAQYNKKEGKNNPLSILKTYNNQDGEFREINRYPGQLGAAGALFKWFKLKFIPGGQNANRPVLFVDGDESFTKVGIERAISKETSMVRNCDWNFWEKFNAIDYFSKNDVLLNLGCANLLYQDEKGLCCWVIEADKKKNRKCLFSYFIAANYLSPAEIKDIQLEDGTTETKNIRGKILKDVAVKIPDNKKLISYYDFSYDELNKCFLEENKLNKEIAGEIIFKELRPGEFKIYKMI